MSTPRSLLCIAISAFCGAVGLLLSVEVLRAR